MEAADGDGGERGRSWYLSKEEIERWSPSRRDGVGAAKEAQLRATYCSFIRDVGLRLQLTQITIATGIVLCHRFYLHQSHAKNEWQTVATVCIFLASKIEDTPCQLERVVTVAHETMYKKNPVAAHRISQKGILEKRKALILVGEALLLSTIRYDFNIQHPYEPLKVALKNLGISQKEVKQAAINLINDALRTTLVLQFKPHYIAAGSLSLAARFHNVRLPTEKGKIWWHQFDVAPKLLEAATLQMKELFMKRNPLPAGPAIQPTPAQTPVEKQQTISTTPAIRPIPAQTPVEKQQIISTTPAIRPIPAQTLEEKPQIISTTPAIRPIPAQSPVEKKQITSTAPAIRPIPAQTPAEKQQIISTTPAIQPTPAQPPVEKQQIISFPKPVLKYTYSRRGLKRSAPAPIPIPSPTIVEKRQVISTVGPDLGQEHSTRGGLNRPTTTPAPVKKQKIKSTPNSGTRHTQSSVGGAMPTRPPSRARTPVKKQQIISTQVPVPRHTQPSVGGERRSTTAPARSPVRKQQIICTPDSVLRHTNPSVGGERKPTTASAPARARSPVGKPQIISTEVTVLRHTHPSAGGERRSATAPARSPVRKQQIISTPDSVLRHTNPSVGGERKPTTAPARARSPVRKPQIINTQVTVLRHTHPSSGGERRSATAPTRSPVRKEQIISTQVTVLRHTHPSAGGERGFATAPSKSPVRKEQIISTPDSVLRHTNPSQRGLKSNNFDRHASRCMRVDSSVHQDSTDSLARNEDSKPLRMHLDHSLNKAAKDGRPEERTLRAALRADHVYHVRSEPKDVNMTRVANFVGKKRKIQEAGEHPALVNRPDGDAWTRPQIRSVIVAPPSWKKQKI